jgi:hypothetical protein
VVYVVIRQFRVQGQARRGRAGNSSNGTTLLFPGAANDS